MDSMDAAGDRMVASRKESEKYKEVIRFEDIIFHYKNKLDPAPLQAHDIRVNLGSGSKMYHYCSICGIDNSKGNPIEMHHIKHIRKGKVTGFSQIMKALGRKMIPCCKQCHNRIHKGEYDGFALRDLYDPDFVTK